MRPPEELLTLARRQHGVLHVSQCGEVSVTPVQLHRLVQTGRLERIGSSCLRFPGHPQTWRQLLTVGLLDLGSDARVGHRSAAALLGFDGFAEGPLSFVVQRQQRRRRTVGEVRSSAVVPLIDRTIVDGFPCTSATRTIVDLASEVTERELQNTVDSAIRLGWTSERFLRQRLAERRGPGHAGVGLLDRVLEGAGGHNRLERAFLQLIMQAGLPRPTTQLTHRRDGQLIARTDFSWELERVIAEVSGHATHSSRLQRRRDAQRQAELTAIGWYVLTFTYEQVMEEPMWFVGVVARTLAARRIATSAIDGA